MLNESHSGFRGRVPPVCETVNVDVFQPVRLGDLEQAVQMFQHGVDPGIGNEAHQVQVTTGFCLGEGALQDGVVLDGSFRKSFVDADDFLVDDAPGPDVLVPHFGVAHDACRQTNIQPAGHQFGTGPFGGQLVRNRRAGLLDGVKGVMLRIVVFTPSITDDQYDWSCFHFSFEFNIRESNQKFIVSKRC